MIGKLNTQEEAAVREFRKIIGEQFGARVRNILLYGSKARGDFHQESDIDVFVLLEDGDFRVRDAIVDISTDLLLKYEVLISPVVLNREEYSQIERWETAYYKDLTREGILIE